MSHHTLSWQTHSSLKLVSTHDEPTVPRHRKDVFSTHDQKQFTSSATLTTHVKDTGENLAEKKQYNGVKVTQNKINYLLTEDFFKNK